MPPEGTPGSAAPAAEAPAPGSAAPAAAPVAPAAPTGTDAAIDAARQRLAETGSIVPKPEGGEGAAETDEQKTAREAAEAAAAAETPEAKAAREAAEAAAAAETPEAKASREAAEAAAAAAAETPEAKTAREAAEAAAAAEHEHPEFVVKLPGIEDRGETEMEIEAPDQESFNRLNRLANEAAIGRQVKTERRAIERQVEQLEAVDDQLAMDPAGFVLERVAAGTRTDLAMQLLFDPGILEAVQETLGKRGFEGGLAGLLENPENLRVLRAELKADRFELRDQMRTQADSRREQRANAQRITAQIDAMIPEAIVGEQRDKLFNEALNDVSARCKRLGITKLDESDVRVLVGDRFRQAGITAAPAKDAGKNGKPAASKPPVTGPTAADLEKARQAKLKAAAAAPAGVGAPAAKPRPELPPTTEGRIAAARKFGLRALLGK